MRRAHRGRRISRQPGLFRNPLPSLAQGLSAPLILASSAPRRQELLSGAGYEFEVLTAEVTEHTGPHFSLRELTTANATAKAFAVVRKRTDAIILAADTLVSIEGEVIGKPANIEDATAILRRLRGRVHDVCTAVFIIGPRGRLVS